MTQTIEAFVKKLHEEGVQAGKDEAGKLLEEARAEADTIVARAEDEAKKIVAAAKTEAQQIAERERGELDLAARDAVLKFRARIAEAVESLLRTGTAEALQESGFLAGIIRDVVTTYAREDAHRDEQIQINVSPEQVESITQWALKYLSDTERDEVRAHVDLKSTLKGAGFEYRISESTVEVTVESIVEVLKEQVSPRLREVLDRALAGGRS